MSASRAAARCLLLLLAGVYVLAQAAAAGAAYVLAQAAAAGARHRPRRCSRWERGGPPGLLPMGPKHGGPGPPRSAGRADAVKTRSCQGKLK